VSPWKWLACGKHPVAADFFQVGHESSIGLSFCRWAQAGYEKTVNRNGQSQQLHSWRFWAKGNGRNDLLLGLLRDNSDSRGRQYPLLMLGIGALKGWTVSWQHLPQACESVWQSIERISAARMSTIREFEQHLDSIRPPRDLDLLAGQLADSQDEEHREPPNGRAIERVNLNHEADPRSLMAFRISSIAADEDPLLPMSAAHRHLHASLQGHAPQIVFMGGTSSTMLMASFFRSLNPHDFLWLWSVTDLETE